MSAANRLVPKSSSAASPQTRPGRSVPAPMRMVVGSGAPAVAKPPATSASGSTIAVGPMETASSQLEIAYIVATSATAMYVARATVLRGSRHSSL